MGKKTKRAAYTSKGTVPSVTRSVRNAMRRDVTETQTMINRLKNWERGKRTVVTVPNPNTNETNKRFIKVEGNDPKAFGPWKRPDK